ncbi:ribonuclease H-like domain-containing protein [Tanacetum coccineum]
MVTRFHVGTNRPTERLNLHVSFISPLPKSYTDEFNNPNWQNAMCDEYNALIKNNTWSLVPRPTDTNIVRSNGSTQIEGIYVDETFSLVVKPEVSLWSEAGPSGLVLMFVAYITQYVTEILEQAHMGGCNSSRTLVDTESKLGDDGDLLFSSSTTSLVAYSDADWAGCPTTRGSTYGYCVFLGNNLLLWSFKRQPTLSHSSVEAKYRGVTNAVAETCWLRNLLRELHTHLSSAMLVYYDNVHVLHVPSRYQYADIFTKGLPSVLFEEFRTSLSVRCPPAQIAKKC